MTNPWLTVPAEDYEAHMASPEVGQLQPLSRLLKTVLEEHHPVSLEALSPIMNLVPPEEFSRVCLENGLREVRQARIPLRRGKNSLSDSTRRIEPGE